MGGQRCASTLCWPLAHTSEGAHDSQSIVASHPCTELLPFPARGADHIKSTAGGSWPSRPSCHPPFASASAAQPTAAIATEGTTSPGAPRGAFCGARGPGRLSVLASAAASCQTYKGGAAVVARGNLGLVRVDKDARVAGWAAATIAHDDSAVRPRDGLLVHHLHGRQRLGLPWSVSVAVARNRCPGPPSLTCTAKSVCSKRGPVMAWSRGRWLSDQTPTRFGACPSFGAAPPSTAVEAVEGAGTAASRWRRLVLKARRGTRRLRAKVPSVLSWGAAMARCEPSRVELAMPF